jgi:four helix bundle protein
MPFEALESKRIYQRAETIAYLIWEMVGGWDWFTKKSVGLQLTRAADSIGANIAEAGGRFHPADVRNYFYYARGSLRETIYWLRRALARRLIQQPVFDQLVMELEHLAREISQCINYQKRRSTAK